MNDLERENFKPIVANPDVASKRRIITMIEDHPEDFPEPFNVDELQDEDFELERQFQKGESIANELHARLKDSESGLSLNESQIIWAKALLRQVIEVLIRKH